MFRAFDKVKAHVTSRFNLTQFKLYYRTSAGSWANLDNPVHFKAAVAEAKTTPELVIKVVGPGDAEPQILPFEDKNPGMSFTGIPPPVAHKEPLLCAQTDSAFGPPPSFINKTTPRPEVALATGAFTAPPPFVQAPYQQISQKDPSINPMPPALLPKEPVGLSFEPHPMIPKPQPAVHNPQLVVPKPQPVVPKPQPSLSVSMLQGVVDIRNPISQVELSSDESLFFSKLLDSSQLTTKVVHYAVHCSLCNAEIQGVRYFCLSPCNESFCSKCEDNHEPAHSLLRFTSPEQAQRFLSR
jgi:hypothetical protein